MLKVTFHTAKDGTNKSCTRRLSVDGGGGRGGGTSKTDKRLARLQDVFTSQAALTGRPSIFFSKVKSQPSAIIAHFRQVSSLLGELYFWWSSVSGARVEIPATVVPTI